jgi:hypothetical protein
MEKKLKCVKCADTFSSKYGFLSERTSCRYHDWVNGKCTDCGQNKRYNCYHKAVRRKSMCTIS